MFSKRLTGKIETALIIMCAALPLLFYGLKHTPQPARRHGAGGTAEQQSARAASSGVARAARLLPLARRLATEVLADVAGRYGGGTEQVRRACARVEAVTDVRLDEGLGDLAEFDEEKPTQVSVGAEYARDLESDDEVVVLLTHELTHAAAVDGDLDGLIAAVAAEARQRAGVFAAAEQQEDLLCEYVGAQALKRFARLYPDREAPAARVGRVFACDQQEGDEADAEHLSSAETWRALRSLDSELRY